MLGKASPGPERHIEGHKLALLQRLDAGTAEAVDLDQHIIAFLGFNCTDTTMHIEPFYVSMIHGLTSVNYSLRLDIPAE